MVTGVSFVDTDSRPGFIGGVLFWNEPLASDVEQYSVYLSKSGISRDFALAPRGTVCIRDLFFLLMKTLRKSKNCQSHAIDIFTPKRIATKNPFYASRV